MSVHYPGGIEPLHALTTTGLTPGSLLPLTSNLWSVQSSSVVSSLTGVGGSRLAISPNNQLIAFLWSSASYIQAIDRLSNSNWIISRFVAPAEHSGLGFSPDSRFLVYVASPAQFQPLQVFFYDFQTRTSVLISQSFDGLNPGNADSDSPIISPDGRFVVYRSSASNLVPGAANHSANIFKFDRTLGATSLLTTSDASVASPANNRSFVPLFSSNGGTLLIPSTASDLVARDFNQSSDLFADTEALYVWVVGRQPGQGPTLAWFVRPGLTYRVQYKTKLNDSEWQDVTGSVNVQGNTAQFTDQPISAIQRFYRVTAF